MTYLCDVYLCGKRSWSGGRSARTTHVMSSPHKLLQNRAREYSAPDSPYYCY
jgi:hypothetical protein